MFHGFKFTALRATLVVLQMRYDSLITRSNHLDALFASFTSDPHRSAEMRQALYEERYRVREKIVTVLREIRYIEAKIQLEVDRDNPPMRICG